MLANPREAARSSARPTWGGRPLPAPDRRLLHLPYLPVESPLQNTRAVLGLLGGIGAGKSHVARRIAALASAAVVDADARAREALDVRARDGRLEAALGPACVRAGGVPDSAAIAQRVFADDDALDALERLVHPVVLAHIHERLEAHREGEGPPLLVLDVPLLLETGLDRTCDTLWFVDTPEALRAERAAARGLGAAEVRRRERRQMPLDSKRARADVVIRSDADLDDQILDGLGRLGMEAVPPS